MYKVAIRVDGGAGIGMGHVMRCIALAKEFRNAGCSPFFISKCGEGLDKIRAEGFKAEELAGVQAARPDSGFFDDGRGIDEEIRSMDGIMEKINADLLIVDTYNVNPRYFLMLRPFARKLCYIDDMNKFTYPVDILVNGNIHAEHIRYKKSSEDEVMLLGVRYNLIRDEFRNLGERKLNGRVNSIMLTTGGADPYNLSEGILRALLADHELGSLTIHAIAGIAFNNRDILKEISRKHRNVLLHENAPRISEIMLASDIAISSGGSTLYELCACGTPTLAFIMADNQEPVVGLLSEKGYIESLGWYTGLSDDGWVKKVKALCADYERRKACSRRMQQLVDGKGPERVVKEIMKVLESANARRKADD